MLFRSYYWMRCSEFSADRAAVLCDGTAEKMSEVCMRLAGFDKDIRQPANKKEFMRQALEYRDMVRDSKWDRTLEFMALAKRTHPLLAVRALECTEWTETDQFREILSGNPPAANAYEGGEPGLSFGAEQLLRSYEKLRTDGVISQEEFEDRRRRLLGFRM